MKEGKPKRNIKLSHQHLYVFYSQKFCQPSSQASQRRKNLYDTTIHLLWFITTFSQIRIADPVDCNSFVLPLHYHDHHFTFVNIQCQCKSTNWFVKWAGQHDWHTNRHHVLTKICVRILYSYVCYVHTCMYG